MKKVLILTIAFLLTFAGASQAQIQWPSGNATFTTATRVAKQSADTITVNNSYYYIDYGTVDTNITVNVTIGPVKKGGFLFIRAESDGTARSVAFGTNIDGVTTSGTINTPKLIGFIYDGTAFRKFSEAVLE